VNRIAAVLLLVLTATGCSRTLYSLSTAQSTATPDVAFECVQNKLKELGYERTRYDAVERWYVARKLDPSISVSSGTFRRAFHVLEVKVHPDASGTTALEIKAQTIHQYELQRGQTDEEQEASVQVRSDAQALARSCTQ
jgi:hypothetical protein